MASKYEVNGERQSTTSVNETRFPPTNVANEEIRDLLLDYVKEIADPVLRAEREKEIIEDERRKGYEVTLFCPEPCYVVKTSIQLKCESNNVTKKVFINICQNNAIEKPSCKRVSQALTKSFYNQDSGLFWTVPHGLTYPRDDVDRRAAFCVVYDCVYHSDTIRLANSNKHFKKMIEEFALDAIENSFNVKLDRTFVKYPKMKFKGKPLTTMMRKKVLMESVDEQSRGNFGCQEMESTHQQENTVEPVSRTAERCLKSPPDDKQHDNVSIQTTSTSVTVPKYLIKYCYQSDILNYAYNNSSRTVVTPWPVTLNVKIFLPGIKCVESLELETNDNMLSLKTANGILPQYELSVKLPYSVNDEDGIAKFSTENEVLIVDLPVVKSNREEPFLVEEHCVDSVSDINEISTVNAQDAEQDNLVSHFEEKLILQSTEFQNDGASDEIHELSITDTDLDQKGSKGCDGFVINDSTYVPKFSCHQSNEELILVIMVERVPRETVNVVYFENGSKCHITFSAMGTNSNVTSYSLYLQLVADCRLEATLEDVNVSDENIVIIFKKCDDSKYYWDGFNYGIDSNSANNYEILVLNALQRKLNILQVRQ